MIFIASFLVILAYLLGSIPSAVWVGRSMHGIDVREHGSRNAGTTNTLRILGRKAALIVFSLDFLKGLAAVMLYHFLKNDLTPTALANLKIALIAAAVVGHIFPIFASFRGGKGVATTAGAIMGVFPAALLICLAIFLVVLLISHYVSLSSIMAGISFPLLDIFLFHERSVPLVIFSIVVAVAFVVMHRKNIKRLINGTESKIYLFK